MGTPRLFICVILCFSIFTTCKGEDSTTNGPTTTTETTTEPNTTMLEETTTVETTTETQCEDNQELLDGDCVCVDGYYLTYDGSCSECDIEHCPLCRDNETEALCVFCNGTFNLLYENQCEASCPSGTKPEYRLDGNGTCESVHACTFQYGSHYVECLAIPIAVGVPLVIGVIVGAVLGARRRRAGARRPTPNMLRRPSMPNPFEMDVNRRGTARFDGNANPMAVVDMNQKPDEASEVITDPLDPRYTPEPTMKVGPPIIPRRESSHCYEEYENLPPTNSGAMSSVSDPDTSAVTRESDRSSGDSNAQELYVNLADVTNSQGDNHNVAPPHALKTEVPAPPGHGELPPPSAAGHSSKAKHSYINLSSLPGNSASPESKQHSYVNIHDAPKSKKKGKSPRRVDSVMQGPPEEDDDEQSVYANT